MNIVELTEALKELQTIKDIQSMLNDDTFLVVEKDCVEVYTKSGGYIPTPCINEDYS